MQIKEKQTIETSAIKDVICNKCGKSCFDTMNFNGLINAEVYGSYDSKILEDFKKYKFDLCEVCLKDLFDSFKISVDIKDYGF